MGFEPFSRMGFNSPDEKNYCSDYGILLPHAVVCGRDRRDRWFLNSRTTRIVKLSLSDRFVLSRVGMPMPCHCSVDHESARSRRTWIAELRANSANVRRAQRAPSGASGGGRKHEVFPVKRARAHTSTSQALHRPASDHTNDVAGRARSPT